MSIKNILEMLNDSVKIINEKIVKVTIKGKDHWQVQSHEGKNLGTYPYTKEGKHQAHIRLGQVEAFKKKNESLEESLNEGITIKKDSSTGEYRVPAPDGKEAGAYYTDDKEDAISTAIDMYKRASKTITKDDIKFRTVSDFDMYQNESLDEKIHNKPSKCHICGHKEFYKNKDCKFECDKCGTEQKGIYKESLVKESYGYYVVKKDNGDYEVKDKKQVYLRTKNKKEAYDFLNRLEYEHEESLDEAKSPEEQAKFDKAEKEVADKLGLTLPLPKDTPREVRNKLYAQVNAKLKKSNVSKCLNKLSEGAKSTVPDKKYLIRRKNKETGRTEEVTYIGSLKNKPTGWTIVKELY